MENGIINPEVENPELYLARKAAIRAAVEAIIYVAEEPVTAEQITAALAAASSPASDAAAASMTLMKQDVLDAILSLQQECCKDDRGLEIREVAGGFKMFTKAEHHETIRQFVKNLTPPLKLSMPALETLATIAYRQPITVPEIQHIRGVNATAVLKTLLDKKLITTAGRKNVIGRPILYKTTKEFLVKFGLSSLAELPTLEEFGELARAALEGSPVEVPATVPRDASANPTEIAESETLAEPRPQGSGVAGSDNAQAEPHPVGRASDAEQRDPQQTPPDTSPPDNGSNGA